jgi:hypothetical protein
VIRSPAVERASCDEDFRDFDGFLQAGLSCHVVWLPFSNIMNVSMSTSLNPPRLSLRLVRPRQLGPEIVFSPVRPFSLNPFARNPIAEDLMVRVDRARSKRPA